MNVGSSAFSIKSSDVARSQLPCSKKNIASRSEDLTFGENFKHSRQTLNSSLSSDNNEEND
ncbi:hypothetical protein E2C01_064095 [Portunus trituberculatus]|uniref:Uncharacterized protein n=1 Tax=Portunus trituberculatus TaxID=210409 RepID=A0A5B7HI60_PORTR|nr:hypothetical protein [Portunus trituberculatus]